MVPQTEAMTIFPYHAYHWFSKNIIMPMLSMQISLPFCSRFITKLCTMDIDCCNTSLTYVDRL